MSAIVKALDSITPVQVGENGHAEFGWSNDIQEKICQFDFQCVRTDDAGIENLSKVLDDILRVLVVKQTSVVLEEKHAISTEERVNTNYHT